MGKGNKLYKVLGVIAGLVFVAYGFQERSSIAKMKSTGHVAIVQPIKNYTESKSGGSSIYLAEFRFQTDSGKEVVQKHSFPEELIEDFKAGVPVRVLYDPNDPSTFVFEKERASWWLVLVGAGVALAALIFA